MWLHLITGYAIVSLAIMEIAMKDSVGKQETSFKRIGYYIGGLIFGPIAALSGVILGIIKIWDSGGR